MTHNTNTAGQVHHISAVLHHIEQTHAYHFIIKCLVALYAPDTLCPCFSTFPKQGTSFQFHVPVNMINLT